jgi:hypothetical protein
MLFKNDPADPRHLIATDYWSSPEGLAGTPVLSFSGRCFRVLFPVKAALKERYAQLAIVIDAIAATQYPEVLATPEAVTIIAGSVALRISWSHVDGISLDEFPASPESCDFSTYVYAGKRGPRMAFRRKATFSQAKPA